MVSRRLAVATTLFLLCSCGGGDNTGNAGASSLVAPAPPPSPPRPPLSASDWGMRSLYGGTITGASTQDIIVVIDGAGALWGVYGTGASTDFRPVGMILSSTPAESTATRLVAPGLDLAPISSSRFSINLAFDPTVPSMNGTVGSKSVAGGMPPGKGNDVNAAASLSTVTGPWTMRPSIGSPFVIDIDATGIFAGGTAECLVQGEIRPGNASKNYFAVALRYAARASMACEERYTHYSEFSGFALAYPLEGGGTQLVLMTWDVWDGFALLASGKR